MQAIGDKDGLLKEPTDCRKTSELGSDIRVNDAIAAEQNEMPAWWCRYLGTCACSLDGFST